MPYPTTHISSAQLIYTFSHSTPPFPTLLQPFWYTLPHPMHPPTPPLLSPIFSFQCPTLPCPCLTIPDPILPYTTPRDPMSRHHIHRFRIPKTYIFRHNPPNTTQPYPASTIQHYSPLSYKLT